MRQIVQDQMAKQVHQKNSLVTFFQHLHQIAVPTAATPQAETKYGMLKAKTLDT